MKSPRGLSEVGNRVWLGWVVVGEDDDKEEDAMQRFS